MANDHQQQGENVSWVRRNFSCMNGINYPLMRMVYLDDVKELGLKLLYPDRRSCIVKELHENMGQLREERTLDLTRERFYWPHMQQDVEHHINMSVNGLNKRPPRLRLRLH